MKFPGAIATPAEWKNSNLPQNSAKQIDTLKEIAGAGEELLADVEVFDVFRGEQLGAGRKSIGFALTYMSTERTLTDAEVDDAHLRVVDRLVARFEASLRG